MDWSTFYTSRFETDDLGRRLLTFLQTVAAALMAVSVRDGLGKNSTGFALIRGNTCHSCYRVPAHWKTMCQQHAHS